MGRGACAEAADAKLCNAPVMEKIAKYANAASGDALQNSFGRNGLRAVCGVPARRHGNQSCAILTVSGIQPHAVPAWPVSGFPTTSQRGMLHLRLSAEV